MPRQSNKSIAALQKDSAKLERQLAEMKRELARNMATQREIRREERNRCRYAVGQFADEAGLFPDDDSLSIENIAFLGPVFRALHACMQEPDVFAEWMTLWGPKTEDAGDSAKVQTAHGGERE